MERRLTRAARAVLAVLLVALGAALVPARPAAADVTTYGGSGLHTGWYADQDGLGPTSVSASDFGQVWSGNVVGQVYAQPLVSQGTVFVATEDDNVYGFNEQTGALQWSRSLHAPWHSVDLNCVDITPNVGITATPVIDPATNTAYFLAKTYANGTNGPAAWFAHAVDVATGAERSGFPVAIVGTATNAPGTQFNPTTENARPGLALVNGVVYAGFAGHCDAPPYQGWLVGISTLGSITTMWSTVANETGGEGSGIWQSGGGIVNDRPGSLVVATGNGTTLPAPTAGSNPPATGYGEAVLRLNIQPDGSLKPVDFFIPYDAEQLNGFDGDLGSGAPLALPPAQFGTPATPNLVVEVGKEGYVYLLNADNLGGYKQGSGGGDAVVNRVGPDGGVWAKPTPWGGDGGYVYVPTSSAGPAAFGTSGFLHAYKYGLDGTGKPTLSLVGASADGFGYASGSAVVTSSGTASGSAVVWTVWRPVNGGNAQLRAYDPVPVNGTMQLRRSFPIGASTKFEVPAVSGNHLFVGTADGHILAFGRPVNAVFTNGPLSYPTTTVGQSSTLNATFTAQQATTVQSSSVTAGAFTIAGAPTPPEGTPIAVGATVTYPVRFSPTAVGATSGTLTITTAQGIAAAALTGTGQSATPLLAVNPTAVSFGGIATGTSRAASITISNAGAQPLTFNSITSPAAPFSASGLPGVGTQLASGASVAVTMTFAPTAAGSFADQLILGSDGGQIAVDLTGSAGAPAQLQVSPTTLAFPNTPANGASDLTFTVSNVGGTDMTITRSKPPVSGGFSAITALPEGSRLAAGTSVTETVRFTPTTAGTFSSTWEVNGDGSSSLTIVQLSGTGTANTGIPAPTSGGWLFNGAAVQQGPLTVLTPPTDYLAGTAFWPQSVDPSTLRVSFDLSIDQGTGADGATFAMVPPNTSTEGTGAIGGGYGWVGLGGVAVVFNEYQSNSVSVRNGGGVVQSTTAIPALRNATNHVDITMSTGNVKVTIGGTQVLNTSVTLPALARVGFTASTGYYNDRHAVSNVAFTNVTVPSPVLSVTPNALAFGSVTVGTGATLNLNVKNTGNAAMTISSTSPPALPFSATLPANGTTLAAGASTTVPVQYSPTAATSSSSSLTITTNGGAATIALTGTGVSASGTVLPTPWSGSGWSINGNASISGSSLILTPNAANQAGNALTTSTYAFNGLHAAFDLTIDQGNGADGACFGLAPASTAATKIGSIGGGMGWSGVGGTAVCFDTYQNSPEPSSNFVGIRTDAGYTATSTAIPALRNATNHVDITLTGTTLVVKVAGVQVLSATLTTATTGRLLFSGGTGGLTDRHLITNASISIGAAPAPVLSVTPSSIAFGSVTVGTTASSSLTVSNTGNAPMTITSTTPPVAPFTATLPANGTTVAAGSSVTVPVQYAPTSATASSSSLTFTTNGGNATVNLTGTGTPTPTPVLTVNPTTVNFGSVTVGTTATTNLTVSNTGNALLTISATTAPAAPFAATLPANGTTIAAGASITVPVRYSPTAVTASGGSVGFTSNGGTVNVPLTGTGVAATGTVVPTPWSGSGWSINGNASISGSSLILTPNAANQAGNAITTSTYAFNGLHAAFDLTIDQGNGADGACFGLLPASTVATKVGGFGGGMGWSTTGGTAVCFDTYQNSPEPSSNFVGIRTDAGYTSTNTAIPALLNSTTHVDITVTGTTLVVKVAGVQVLSATLTTATTGRLLFSAGTGGLTDRHLITNAVITIG